MRKLRLKTTILDKQHVKIDAPVIKVWSILTGINDWHKWQTRARKAKLRSNLEPGATFTYQVALLKFKSNIDSCEPFHSFGWTSKLPGSFKTIKWMLESENKSTNVIVEESIKGPLYGLLNGPLTKKLQKSMARRLADLKMASEKNTLDS